MVTIETPRSPRSRTSGVILIVLVFGHLYINLFTGEGIKAIDFAFVAGKWADPFWQVWDTAMLWLALIHGTNGMRTLVNDYSERERTRKILNTSLWTVCILLIILGTLVTTTFDACVDPSVADVIPQCLGK